ncbi:type IV pilus modification protein PilV [Dyella kyungheensis]|uniref:Type IV pilus modification protein PilV n=1 Tax=Dyella kyungheensis TaxID=1242174 RepID=A0ABS2JNV0_9GAMM|nr:type IV pilus modification protein PilV [Dyella kyungheensis]MBM7120705.1 type IV pilus modification protein PilV [Dyella kyungheensis]
MKHSFSSHTRGFSLLEVLIAVVVISLGALGIAAMQATAISGTHSSQQESVIALEARSMSDAMIANSGYWGAGNAPATLAVSSSTALSDGTLQGFSNDCSATTCSAPQLASYDLKRWAADLQGQVPGAQGAITCQAGAPVICTVQISWKPNATIAINGGTQGAPASASTVSYSLTNQL